MKDETQQHVTKLKMYKKNILNQLRIFPAQTLVLCKMLK
jgi:hypothetical protein